MLRSKKPYSRPASASHPVVKAERPPEIKPERSSQFKAASSKYGKRVGESEIGTRLVAFVNIKLNHLATPEMNDKVKIVHQQQPSIFNKTDVRAFIHACTFVVAFAHPTYHIEYKMSSNQLLIFCSNINKDLLFKNTNRQLRNLLPDVSAFRVQLNDEPLYRIQTAMYDALKLVLSIEFSNRLAKQLLPLNKCVIYLNILPATEWAPPPSLLRAFADLPLEPPKLLAQKT